MATWPRSKRGLQRDPWALRVEARGPPSSLFSLCRPNSGCRVPHPRIQVTEVHPTPAARAAAEATREAGQGPSLPTPCPASSIHRRASTKYLVTPFQASFCSSNRAHYVLSRDQLGAWRGVKIRNCSDSGTHQERFPKLVVFVWEIHESEALASLMTGSPSGGHLGQVWE